MASGGALAGLVRPMGRRAVHLRLFPRTETIAEGREVLRLIQQYGRVEMFRNLKYDILSTPSTMVAIFETEESALELLRASPLRFYMRSEDSGERSISNSETPSDSTDIPVRHYQLQINHSNLNHRDQNEQIAYNGSFKVATNSAIQEDLITKVPMTGLSEFTLKKEEKPWRVIQTEKFREEKEATPLRRMLEEGLIVKKAPSRLQEEQASIEHTAT